MPGIHTYLIHNNVKLSYTLHSRRRTTKLSISINTDGMVRVTKPTRATIVSIESLLIEKWDWIHNARESLLKKPKKLLANYGPEDYKRYKQQAHELVEERVRYFNAFYKCTVNSILVKNQKTRWGSCSSRKILTFNYKIVFLPKELQDYIIVHELCHIQEMNHSYKFWNLVSLHIPNYTERRKAIKLY